MELNEKDASLRNKGRSKPLRDHEKKIVEAVGSWNINAFYNLCSSKRSIANLQKSEVHSAEFTKLQQSAVEMEASVLEATMPVSSVTTESSHLFVNRLVKKGYSQEFVNAVDKLMSSKSSRREHDYKSILREKCFLAERALATPATDNLTGKSLAAEFNILEVKHEVANDKIVIIDGYYVDEEGNEVPRGTEDATMIVEPDTAFQYNPMSGVEEHQTSVTVLHWHSGWDESEDDESKPEKSKSKKPKSKKTKSNPKKSNPKKTKAKKTKEEVLAKGCITALTDMDTALLHLEAGGGDMTLDQRTQMKEGLAVFDIYSFISAKKKNWKIEKMLYGRIVDMSDLELTIDGIIRVEIQCLVNELNGEQSRVGFFSAEGSRQCLSIVGACGDIDRITVTSMPHGQPQCCPKIMMAENNCSLGDLFDYSAGLGIIHSINDRINVSSTSKSMVIIAEREEMPAEMQAERFQALKQQLSENAKKAYETSSKRKVGLPNYINDQSEAGKKKRKRANKVGYETSSNRKVGLPNYINDQSEAGKKKRKRANKVGYETSSKRNVGLPKYINDQSEAGKKKRKRTYETSSKRNVGLPNYNNDQSEAGKKKRKTATKAGYDTNKKRNTGLYRYHNDQSEAGKAKRSAGSKKANDSRRSGTVQKRGKKWVSISFLIKCLKA